MSLTISELQQYSRQLILPEINLLGQDKFKAAKVLVIGAGGLGCPILQYLTAAGIGEIGIIDHDVVDQSNLHRQILFTHDDVGKEKVATTNNIRLTILDVVFKQKKRSKMTSCLVWLSR